MPTSAAARPHLTLVPSPAPKKKYPPTIRLQRRRKPALGTVISALYARRDQVLALHAAGEVVAYDDESGEVIAYDAGDEVAPILLAFARQLADTGNVVPVVVVTKAGDVEIVRIPLHRPAVGLPPAPPAPPEPVTFRARLAEPFHWIANAARWIAFAIKGRKVAS